MPYQVDRFNGTFLVSVADGTVDTTTDIRLLGKNYAGYGEVQNENFLHLLENFANTNPPPKAINGQIWFDSSSKKLKYYDADNTKWRTTGSLEVSSAAPVKMNVGDFWYDTSADQLYSWNGNSFVLIGPQPTVAGGQTATAVAIVKGTNGINYNIVKLLAGAGDTVAIVSNDAFTLDLTPSAPVQNFIPGFEQIKKGVNLVNTNGTTGITTGDTTFWGTASNSLKLGGIQASDFIQKSNPTFISQVSFTNAGYTVGSPGNNLAVFIELGDQPVIESRNSARVTLRIRESSNVAYDIMEFIPPTSNPGAAIPGLDSTYDLGSSIYKWANIYSNSFIGDVTGNLVGNTTGVHKGNILASDNSVAYNATSKNFTGSFAGILTGNVIGDVTGTSSNAFTLNNLQSSVDTINSTIVVRDTAGNINANNFQGTASRSNQLLVAGIGFQSATTNPTANTIVVRDGNGNINVNLVNGTTTAANTLQADNSGYVNATSQAIGNTIVVRDFAGRINVTGINGAATSADQLQVDGTSYRLASTSAISNTIAARDATGTLRATGLENTPIGASTRSTGAFTTLTSNGVTTVTNATEAISKTTGALQVTGGVGVGGNVHATAFFGNFVGSFSGNVAGTATTATTAASASTSTRVEASVTGTSTAELVRGNMASNDQFRILVGGTAIDGGYAEIATADNGNEPIFVRQYTGTFSSITRTAALLDADGNTSFPGTVTSNALVEQSSIVYKENVNPIADALEIVNKLSGVLYDRKDKTQKNQPGFIAEDVEKILPNIVQLNKDGHADGIQYTKLTAYLVEAVKALTQEVQELKSKLK
jgi:hypothetical protein